MGGTQTVEQTRTMVQNHVLNATNKTLTQKSTQVNQSSTTIQSINDIEVTGLPFPGPVPPTHSGEDGETATVTVLRERIRGRTTSRTSRSSPWPP